MRCKGSEAARRFLAVVRTGTEGRFKDLPVDLGSGEGAVFRFGRCLRVMGPHSALIVAAVSAALACLAASSSMSIFVCALASAVFASSRSFSTSEDHDFS